MDYLIHDQTCNLASIQESRTLSLSKVDISKIHNALLQKDRGLFDGLVIKEVTRWLDSHIADFHPILESEKKDILTAVGRRTRNWIMDCELETAHIDIEQRVIDFIELECQANLPTEENKKKNLGLTKSEFKKLVTELQQGDEGLVEKVYLAQFTKTKNIVMKRAGCKEDVAYNATIEALIDIRKELLHDKLLYGNLESYFITKAINKYYRLGRKKRIQTLPITEVSEFTGSYEMPDDLVAADLREMVSNAISKLGKECQFILKAFYYQEKNFNEIGKELNKSHQSVRKQASRCRNRMKSILSMKFYESFASIF